MRRSGPLASTLALLLLLSLLLAACGSEPGGSPSAPPGASGPAASAPVETDAPVETEPVDPSLPLTSETEWGPIWNAIPSSYPVPEGAEIADPDHGPVSAAFTVAAGDAAPRAIGEFYRDQLEELGFGGTGLDGPLEDGSFTVWSSNGYGCDSLVTIMPRGDESLIAVLYGAGCSFE